MWPFSLQKSPKQTAPWTQPATAAVMDRVAAAFKRERDAAYAALREIAAMETAVPNATVKRMAAKARDSVPASVKGEG